MTQVIYPPQEIFADKGAEISQQASAGQQDVTAHHVEFPEEGGMLLYFDNWKYPKKGWPFREAVNAIDSIKRGAMASIKFTASKPMRYIVPFFYFLPRSWKRGIMLNAMREFGNFGERCYHRCTMNPKYYCKIVREVYRVCMPIAGDDIYLQQFVTSICMVLEYDDAYRYRFQDSLELFDKENFLKNPAEEIKKMMVTIAGRDNSISLKENMARLGMFVGMIMQLKVIREPLIDIVKQLDIEKMKLDDGDWYQCLTWIGYDFRGKKLSERLIEREAIENDPTKGTWMNDPVIKELEKKYKYQNA